LPRARLSAEELDEALHSNGLLKILSRLRVPWLVIYWLYAFMIWRPCRLSHDGADLQEWVVPFGLSRQIPIYHDVIQYFFPRNIKSALYYRHTFAGSQRKVPLIYCVTNATGRHGQKESSAPRL